jgi:hypothetical protein
MENKSRKELIEFIMKEENGNESYEAFLDSLSHPELVNLANELDEL